MSVAADFLKKWSAHGPWLLTAIHPERRHLIETRAFSPATLADMEAWIAGYDGERNLYFSVNPARADLLNKKADREDITALAWLHVDVDPREGHDIEEERRKALAALTAPPVGVPAPTVILFSGGGYQAFWRLAEALPLDGTVPMADEAARYNRQLEVLFGGDHCHNIDRIMRLPGTWNVPDAKKRAKGRQKVRAEVVSFDGTRVYDLSEFMPAPAKQSSSTGWIAPALPALVRLSSVDDLPDAVSDRTKVVIVQGTDPENPTRHPSRSEWLFMVVCDLVRAGVDDSVIFSVITDPDFKISASVLEKGSRADHYALHQIERARNHAIHPALNELNERFAVIGNIGGKCRIVEEIPDTTFGGRVRISKQSFEDFRNRYSNRKVEVGRTKDGQPAYKPLGVWWLAHEKRKQFETLVFSPGGEVPGAYNLWRGFACEAKPGDCGLLLGHLFENLCNGNEDHYNYVLGWMAMAVQHPNQPGETAIVMRGRQGTGKSFFVKQFGSLWGRHFLQVSNAKHLVGNFNAHLRDCVVLLADEAFYAGDKQHEGSLKTLVTEERIMYEQKGIDSEYGPNFTHIFMCSNSAWVVPAGGEERRYFVLDVADHRMQDTSYFAAIKQQMENGGREALLHMLRTFPLDGFNVRAVPRTSALADQKLHSLGPEEEWWYNKLCEGSVLHHQAEWPAWVSRSDLFEDYSVHMQKIGRMYRANPTVLGRFLRRVTPGAVLPIRTKTITTGGPYEGSVTRPVAGYELPPLDACRRYWLENFGDFGDF